MRTIATTETLAEIVVQRSRFIAALARLDTESAARGFVAVRRKTHHAARHHATAWVLGRHGHTRRSSDDGEPAATAGAPMLAVLTGAGLTDTVAVVTRYFGGTKLGTGGLARAYGSAVTAALDACGTVEQRLVHTVTITCPHAEAGRLHAELHAQGHTVTGTRYGQAVRIDILADDVETLAAWLAVRAPQAEFTVTGTTVVND